MSKPKSKPKFILCPNPECGHDIDRHRPSVSTERHWWCFECWKSGKDYCTLAPSDIARELLADVRSEAAPACPVHDPGAWDDPRNEAGECICPVPRAEYERVLARLTAEPTDDEVEAAAEALWVASWTHSTWLDPTVDPSVWHALRTQARAALRAARGLA